MSVDLQPDELDALQAEPGPEPAVRVIVDGPVRTQVLPRKQAATRTRTITTTVQQILAADHRRAAATLIAPSGFLFAFTPAAAQDPSTMAAWPANVPFTLTADAALFVAAASGTVAISIITEFWATGE